MKVKFIKKCTIGGGKPFTVGFEYTFRPQMAKELYQKGLVEILDDHDFEAPKKTEKKAKKKEDKNLQDN